MTVGSCGRAVIPLSRKSSRAPAVANLGTAGDSRAWAVVFEDLAGFPDESPADAGGGDLQQVREDRSWRTPCCW